VDSAALIALFNKNDQYHKEALEYYSLLTKTTKLVTTLLVISETYTWFRYHANYNLAFDFLEVINDAVSLDWLKVIYPDHILNIKTQNILLHYNDQKLSYVDATSIAVIEDLKIQDVFSFDSHFHIIKKNVWPRGY
jgi:predicted nucleic acid-binding protein